MKTTIWHNPRCSKSREAVALAEEVGIQSEVRKYLDDAPTLAELKEVFQMLELSSIREWMRTGESIYKELNLKEETDEEKLLQAMLDNPKLIQRPVLIKGNKAIIGRPFSIIEEFLKS